VSFSDIFSMIPTVEGETTYIILAPTHRSFFDFLLLSYVFFALPELQLDIPFIIAADEFEQLPIIGIIARMLRAFYIRRGGGCPDKDLTTKLASLKSKKLSESGGCLEVFLEGKRSRDRRFAYPKTGLLKSLKESGGRHIIVPIAINYEAIPEQKQLSVEASGTSRGALNVVGMLRWLRVSSGFVPYLLMLYRI
jgi:glycerol-3-phosphate O-acyltransferase